MSRINNTKDVKQFWFDPRLIGSGVRYVPNLDIAIHTSGPTITDDNHYEQAHRSFEYVKSIYHDMENLYHHPKFGEVPLPFPGTIGVAKHFKLWPAGTPDMNQALDTARDMLQSGHPMLLSYNDTVYGIPFYNRVPNGVHDIKVQYVDVERNLSERRNWPTFKELKDLALEQNRSLKNSSFVVSSYSLQNSEFVYPQVNIADLMTTPTKPGELPDILYVTPELKDAPEGKYLITPGYTVHNTLEAAVYELQNVLDKQIGYSTAASNTDIHVQIRKASVQTLLRGHLVPEGVKLTYRLELMSPAAIQALTPEVVGWVLVNVGVLNNPFPRTRLLEDIDFSGFTGKDENHEFGDLIYENITNIY